MKRTLYFLSRCNECAGSEETSVTSTSTTPTTTKGLQPVSFDTEVGIHAVIVQFSPLDNRLI